MSVASCFFLLLLEHVMDGLEMPLIQLARQVELEHLLHVLHLLLLLLHIVVHLHQGVRIDIFHLNSRLDHV